ncbi:MAG: LytTR family DNA-binding domain-containing protein [Blautia sp.]|nr:LytTR family DNA-binding domain-containing protein [Blautia sp.]MCM1202447.1 LytTR family DNA-binding domain-containing protein [Bacteroides fragilis]
MEYTGDELFWIAICDDEKDSAREIREILMEGEAEPGEFKISVFPSGAALMNANVGRYDLLILDMVLPGENGREIAHEYRSKNKDGIFVFCTGKVSPVPEDFRMGPYRYMRKEYPRRLRRDLLETVEEMYRRRIKSRLKVTEGKTTILLHIEDILYLEIAKSGSYIYYFKRPDELCTVRVKEKPRELYPRLFAYGFEFAHNSYLVNCRYLHKWNSRELELVNGKRLSVSRAREKKFTEAAMKYIT